MCSKTKDKNIIVMGEKSQALSQRFKKNKKGGKVIKELGDLGS